MRRQVAAREELGRLDHAAEVRALDLQRIADPRAVPEEHRVVALSEELIERFCSAGADIRVADEFDRQMPQFVELLVEHALL